MGLILQTLLAVLLLINGSSTFKWSTLTAEVDSKLSTVAKPTTNVTVVESDFPRPLLGHTLKMINASYAFFPDRSRIAQNIQRGLTNYQSSLKWNVAINYEAISYYSRFRAVLRRDPDYLIVFGL